MALPPPPPFPPPFLLHFLLCTLSSLLVVGGLNSEGIALLSFKSAVRDDPSGSLANWNSSHPDPCSWNGISCGGGSVAALSLPKKKLVGFLPSALGSLQSLRHVNLRNNRLFGGLPAGLLAARRLQSLVLYGNFFSGSVPQEIGDLSYLQSLDLSRNLFTGSLPSSLKQCQRLKTLILSHNNFTGSLPLGFGGSLVGLEKLDLSYNRFNGSIPSDLGNLSNLQGTLDLSHNRLSGSIPPGLGNLPEKVYIDLTYNDLSGPIPQNGALENRGPTALIGNPNLCGPPLKNPCPSDSPSTSPFLPNNSPMALEGNATNAGRSNNRGLSKAAVIAIVVSDLVAICLIALVFFYLYSKATASHGIKEETWKSNSWCSKSNKECICFRKEDSESLSGDIEQFELVPLDNHMTFDLNELLKASAFVLGKSGIGIVYKVVLDSGLAMAVRRLGEGGSQRFKEFQTEVEAIGKVRHPNIVALRAYYWSIDEKLLIYDYIPNGNLSTAIHGRSETTNFAPLSWEVRLKIMKGIANGLAFLHEFSPKKYVHGDLKPNNVLLGSDMEPYISDFGVGRLANIAGGSPFLQSDRIAAEKTESHRQRQDVELSSIISKGSCYQAPEALRTLKPSQKWDVYSYGVILLELISGRSPVFLLETLAMDLVCWIQFCIQEKKPLSEVLDPSLLQNLDRQEELIAALKIALACVQATPEKRPSMRYVNDTLERLIDG